MDAWRARLDDQAYEDAIRYCANSILPMHFGEKLINKIFGRNLQSHAAGLLAVMHCEAELGLGERPTLTRIQAEMGRSRTLSGFFALLRFAREQPQAQAVQVVRHLPHSHALGGIQVKRGDDYLNGLVA